MATQGRDTQGSGTIVARRSPGAQEGQVTTYKSISLAASRDDCTHARRNDGNGSTLLHDGDILEVTKTGRVIDHVVHKRTGDVLDMASLRMIMCRNYDADGETGTTCLCGNALRGQNDYCVFCTKARTEEAERKKREDVITLPPHLPKPKHEHKPKPKHKPKHKTKTNPDPNPIAKITKSI